MVRKNYHTEFFSRRPKHFRDRPYDPRIQILNCLHFPLDASLMPHFIRCFQMNIHKITAAFCQRLYRGFCLTLVIGVKPSVCPVYRNHFHRSSDRDSFQQVYGRNHGSRLSRHFLERRKLRLCAGAPEPAGICGIFPLFPALYINRMIFEDLIAFFHHFPKFWMLRQICADVFA